MTNQNVVVRESMGMAVAAVANPTPIFPYLPPKVGGADAVAAGGFGVRRKCLPQLDVSENGGSERINVWIETMKASSPTHKSAATQGASASLADQNEHSNWMVSDLGLSVFFARCGFRF